MASWHSTPLEVLYNVLGWVAFVSWSISFYPQVILNFRRKRFPNFSPSLSLSSSSSSWLEKVLAQCGRIEFRFRGVEFDQAHLISYLQRFTLLRLFCSDAVPSEIWLWWGYFLFYFFSFFVISAYIIAFVNVWVISPSCYPIGSYSIDNLGISLLQMIPVAANDVAFSVHAVLLTAITLFQIAIYDVSTCLHFLILFDILVQLWLRYSNEDHIFDTLRS